MEMPLGGLDKSEQLITRLKHFDNIRAIHIPYALETAVKRPWNDVAASNTFECFKWGRSSFSCS